MRSGQLGGGSVKRLKRAERDEEGVEAKEIPFFCAVCPPGRPGGHSYTLSRSARLTRTSEFNQQIPPGILLGFCPLSSKGIQEFNGHTAILYMWISDGL